jgi:hypothetical protein
MLDGAELGEALTAHPDDVETALIEYERAMFLRGAETVSDEMPGIDSADNTAHGVIAMFTEKAR